MVIVLVHGFNVKDGGGGTVEKLRTPLEQQGLRVKSFRYGWATLLDVYVANGNIAESLLCLVEALRDPQEPVWLVGHSNGCAIIHKALRILEKEPKQWQGCGAIAGVVFIAPALNANTKPIGKVPHYALYTSHDTTVRAASFLPCLIWGRMGCIGPSDPAIRGIDCSLWARGHSDYFSPAGVDKTVQAIHYCISDAGVMG